MKRKGNSKRIVLIVALVVLSYPLLEWCTPLNVSGDPSGKSRHEWEVPWNFENWSTGDFQTSAQRYFNDNIGLYTFLIRLHNQIEYSFFGNIHTADVHIGKNNYLYETTYLNAYGGSDFIGVEAIERKTARLKELQDTLTKLNKPFLFCMSANKTLYYPEYLPTPMHRDTTNYRFVKAAFDRVGINYLDCNTWFAQMKDSLGHLLYPQYGIHWSHYSTVLVADSLSKIYSQMGHWQLPEVDMHSVELADSTRYYDNDIAKSMNLFYEIEPDQKMAYPEFDWTDAPDSSKKLLVIGDSFFWDFQLNNGFAGQCFDTITFLYYNMMVHTKPDPKGVAEVQPLARHFTMTELLNQHDAVLLMSNEPGLPKFGWGFLEDALNFYRDGVNEPGWRNDETLVNKCYNNANWKRQLQRAAERRGISLDSMINIYIHDRTYDPYGINDLAN